MTQTKKTVLITGCSTGFGLETARHFLTQGWRVVATMRSPEDSKLGAHENLLVLPLDVTKPKSVDAAIRDAGPIDVLVNNAGIGLVNAFEATPIDTARQIFETNVFGVMTLTQAVLPQMRERGEGVIVDVSSSVTQGAYPLLSVYTASKWALNAYGEVLGAELARFGIRVRTILPGLAPSTNFGDQSQARARSVGGIPAAYQPMMEEMMRSWEEQSSADVTHPEDVANAVFRAATDPDCPLRLPAGADAEALAAKRQAR